MDFVWQYLKGPSAWNRMGTFNELEYSVRSVKQNCKDARCIVVGDRPDVDDVIHINSYTVDNSLPNGPRQAVDQYYKLKTMLNSSLIGDEFVLMYDDIYILQPTTTDELRINWAKAEIEDIDHYVRHDRIGTMSYRRIWKVTYVAVQLMRDMKGQATYDWETHTPRFFEKDKLDKVLSSTDFVKNPKIVPAIYDGIYETDTRILTGAIHSDLFAHNNHINFEEEFAKKYMHIYDNIIVSDFIQHMEKKFGKCN